MKGGDTHLTMHLNDLRFEGASYDSSGSRWGLTRGIGTFPPFNP